MYDTFVKNVVASTFESIVFILRQYRNMNSNPQHRKNSIYELI